jgi:hypothetical protein
MKMVILITKNWQFPQRSGFVKDFFVGIGRLLRHNIFKPQKRVFLAAAIPLFQREVLRVFVHHDVDFHSIADADNRAEDLLDAE